MSPVIVRSSLRTDRFPRVSGDEPVRKLMAFEGGMFSPRERG